MTDLRKVAEEMAAAGVALLDSMDELDVLANQKSVAEMNRALSKYNGLIGGGEEVPQATLSGQRADSQACSDQDIIDDFLDQRLCCSGVECGCMGATKREEILHYGRLGKTTPLSTRKPEQSEADR